MDCYDNLFEAGYAVNSVGDSWEQSPAHLAACGGQAFCLLWLLQTGADANQKVHSRAIHYNVKSNTAAIIPTKLMLCQTSSHHMNKVSFFVHEGHLWWDARPQSSPYGKPRMPQRSSSQWCETWVGVVPFAFLEISCFQTFIYIFTIHFLPTGFVTTMARLRRIWRGITASRNVVAFWARYVSQDTAKAA